MRTDRRSSLPFHLRFLLTSAFFVSNFTLFAAVDSAVFHANAALASSGTEVEREAIAPTASRSSYRWNLSNDDLPLISLPDHIHEGLDLSLAYSMDQFEFPLFQSLYYNERAGKYILMVIPKEGRDDQAASQRAGLNRRAEFIDLYPVRGRTEFGAKGKLSLRVIDNGKRLLSTREGTVYTFNTFADGELHCSQIKDRDGVVIDLEYSNDSSIQRIADSRLRSSWLHVPHQPTYSHGCGRDLLLPATGPAHECHTRGFSRDKFSVDQ